MKKINIAIDGPSGAGKSTLSQQIAKELSFIYIDTGALYRAVGLFILKNGAAKDDTPAICELIKKITISLKYEDGEQKVLLNGEDVSKEIRTPDISMYASAVSAIPKVREMLFDLQRNLASENDAVMDGRDIGTVVLPDADIKIFLTAIPEERAKRRFDELVLRGQDVKFEDVFKDLLIRDKNDSSREVAPLKPAEDAKVIDTTGNTFEKSLEVLLAYIKEKMKS